MKASIFFKSLILGCWLFFLFCVFQTYLPYNPLGFTQNTNLTVKALCPQGWGFFTKNPKEPDFYIYKRINNKWEFILLTPNSSLSNYIGLKRNVRAQGSEYALICKDIDPKLWLNCNEGVNVFSCFENTFKNKPIVVQNNFPTPSIKGLIWIVSREMVPWAWGKHENINMSSKYIKLHVVVKNK